MPSPAEQAASFLTPCLKLPRPLSLSMEEWENRIDPALFELGKRKDAARLTLPFGGTAVHFCGNDPRCREHLERSSQGTAGASKSELYLYVFSGLDDLGILRRLNEYPDETERAVIEAPWAAECADLNAFVAVNCK